MARRNWSRFSTNWICAYLVSAARWWSSSPFPVRCLLQSISTWFLMHKNKSFGIKSLFTFHLQSENSKQLNTSWSTGSFIRRHVPECALFMAVEIVKGKRGSGETLAVLRKSQIWTYGSHIQWTCSCYRQHFKFQRSCTIFVVKSIKYV